MKNIKYLLSVSLLICVDFSYAMKRSAESISSASEIKTYFVPQDAVGQRLIEFLDQAENKILVAIYLILDETIIDKLIDLKANGIEVQVIIDESNFKNVRHPIQFMNRFLDNGISFMVYPSRQFELMSLPIGLMHHKFAVSDDDAVFTGSANFTPPGLRKRPGDANNYENVVVMNNATIAQRYISAFEELKNDVLNKYIQFISRSSGFPNWMQNLFRKSPRNIILRIRDGLEENHKNRLRNFILTDNQKNVLLREQYTLADIDSMSHEHASRLVGRIMDEVRRRAPAPASFA